MKHVDNGPPYPDEIVFVGVGAIYRLNSSWPKSENIAVLDRAVGDLDYVGKHRLYDGWPKGTRWFDSDGAFYHEYGKAPSDELVDHMHHPLEIGDTWD